MKGIWTKLIASHETSRQTFFKTDNYEMRQLFGRRTPHLISTSIALIEIKILNDYFRNDNKW